MKKLIAILFTLFVSFTLMNGQTDEKTNIDKNGIIWQKNIAYNNNGEVIIKEKERKLITRRRGTSEMKTKLIIIKQYNNGKRIDKSIVIKVIGGCTCRIEESQEYKHRFPALFLKRMNNYLGLLFIPVDIWWLYKDNLE